MSASAHGCKLGASSGSRSAARFRRYLGTPSTKLWGTIQIPERSGLSSDVYAGAAERSAVPSGLLGISGVFTCSHCAKAATAAQKIATHVAIRIVAVLLDITDPRFR